MPLGTVEAHARAYRRVAPLYSRVFKKSSEASSRDADLPPFDFK